MTTAHSDRRAIVFDTETTGLIENSAIPLKQQPHIIELCAIEIDLNPELFCWGCDDDHWPEARDKLLSEAPMFSSLFNPGTKIEEETTKITGITGEMLLTAIPFASKIKEMQRFFLGATHMVGHNLSFDRDMLAIELKRLNMECQFPWPPRHICTVEQTETIEGYRLGLNDLHEKLTGARFNEHHRAEPDTRATARCFVELVRQGIIRI